INSRIRIFNHSYVKIDINILRLKKNLEKIKSFTMQVTSKSLACFITLLRTKEPLLKRTVIVACYVMGMPKKEIARKLQFSLSCVKRSIKKYQCNQPLTDKARCGRPRKLTTAGENRLCKMVHN